MKKIFSLLMVVAIVFTMSFATMAATEVVNVGINVSFVEDANGIVTASVTAVGLNALQTAKIIFKYDTNVVTLLDKNKATVGTVNYANCVVANASVAAWPNTFTDSSAKITLSLVRPDSSTTVDCTNSTELFKVYFEKADGATLTSSAFTLQANKLSAKSGYVNDNTELLFANDATKYSFIVTPYTAPVNPDPVEWDGFTTEETKNWATGFKFVADEEGTTSTSYTGKKVIAFGKNASGDTLTAGSYGIQIGENQYAGQAPVDAGAVFAIILVDSADTKITADSYGYSIYDTTGVVKAGLTATVE